MKRPTGCGRGLGANRGICTYNRKSDFESLADFRFLITDERCVCHCLPERNDASRVEEALLALTFPQQASAASSAGSEQETTRDAGEQWHTLLDLLECSPTARLGLEKTPEV